MKDFLNVNLTTYNKNYLDIAFEHNENRTKNGAEIDYLLKVEDRLENFSLAYNDFYELENKRLERLKENGKEDYQQKHLVEFEVNLSNEKIMEYINNGIDINEGFKQLVKDLESKFNIKTIQLNVHKDEGHYKDDQAIYNIHAHILAFNYDFENDKAIISNWKKKDFRDLQTLASNSFKIVGLDFKRGISKFATKKEHLERNDHIAEKQRNEIRKQIIELQNKNKETKELYTFINKQKQELLELRKEFAKDSNTYKVLSLNIESLKIEDKKHREEYKELEKNLKNINEKIGIQTIKIDDIENYKIEIQNDIKEYLKQNITKKDNKYTINNIKDFYEDLVNTIYTASNLDLKLEQNNKLKNEKKDLIQKVENLENEKETLKSKVLENEKYKEKFTKLEYKFDQLENENKELKEYVNKKNLQNDFNNYKNNLENDNNNAFNLH